MRAGGEASVEEHTGEPLSLAAISASSVKSQWLKAGVLEDNGSVGPGYRGTGQAAVILAYSWPTSTYTTLSTSGPSAGDGAKPRGDMIIVRYADDFIVGCQHESDARCFPDALRERLRGFALSLHPAKTPLIEFCRFATKAARSTPSIPSRALLAEAQEPGRPHASKAHGGEGGDAVAQAPTGPRTGKVAGPSRSRLLRVPRSADENSTRSVTASWTYGDARSSGEANGTGPLGNG